MVGHEAEYPGAAPGGTGETQLMTPSLSPSQQDSAQLLGMGAPTPPGSSSPSREGKADSVSVLSVGLWILAFFLPPLARVKQYRVKQDEAPKF